MSSLLLLWLLLLLSLSKGLLLMLFWLLLVLLFNSVSSSLSCLGVEIKHKVDIHSGDADDDIACEEKDDENGDDKGSLIAA
jgi:hypothetical protein